MIRTVSLEMLERVRKRHIKKIKKTSLPQIKKISMPQKKKKPIIKPIKIKSIKIIKNPPTEKAKTYNHHWKRIKHDHQYQKMIQELRAELYRRGYETIPLRKFKDCFYETII